MALSASEIQAIEQAVSILEKLVADLKPDPPKPEPEPKPPPKPEPEGPTRAQIIDRYFKEKNYWPKIPYQPIGELIVDICENHTGDDPLWVSTMATACEIEGGGKNITGCDAGSNTCNVPVTRESVQRIIDHFHQTGTSNGIGPMQVTYFPFIQKAESMGGAHIMRNSMTVGAQYLNDLLNRYDYLNAIEAYNDGNPRFNDPNNPYESKFAALHVQWRRRLRGAVDNKEPQPKPDPHKPEPKPSGGWDPVNGSLAPPGFVRLPPRPGNYTAQNPTRFIWRPDVEQVVRDLYEEFGRYNIFVNTYVRHPVEANPPRPNVSLDVWGGGGGRPGYRGLWLPSGIGKQVWKYLWSDKTPTIRWGIYEKRIYGIWSGYKPEVFPADGTSNRFVDHFDHIHITFDGPFEQIS